MVIGSYKHQVRTILYSFIIILLGMVIYASSLSVPFTFDDKPNIVENPVIKDQDLFLDAALLRSDILDSRIKPFFANRVIGYLSFMLNYKNDGLNIIGYHLINLLIHLGNALLVYIFVLLLFKTKSLKNQISTEEDNNLPYFIAFFSSLLFVSHPIQTQAVTYIVQRFTSMATLFYLLSVVSYIKWRSTVKNSLHNLFYIISFLSAVLAMRTKEISFTLPFIIVLIEFMFFGGEIKKRILYQIPFLSTLAIIPLTLIAAATSAGNAVSTSFDVSSTPEITRWDYLFTQMSVICTYLRLLFFPINQNIDYDYPVFHTLFTPQVFLSVLLIGAIFSLAIILLQISKRNSPHSFRFKMLSFGLFWFFITLSIESSIIPIKDVIFEHRLYLPSIGFFIAFMVLMGLLKLKLAQKKNFFENMFLPLIVCIVLLLSYTSYTRNLIWQEETILWEDSVTKSPNKARPHNNLALAYFDKGHFENALDEFRKSLQLKPDPGVHVNIGNIFSRQGRLEDAMKEYNLAIALKPDYEKAYNNMGSIFLKRKQFSNAKQAIEIAIKLKPDYAEAYNNMGLLYSEQGDYENAVKEFRHSLLYRPDLVMVRNNLGIAYLKMKKYYAALKEFQIVYRHGPYYIGSIINVGRTYHRLGQLEDAVNVYGIVLKIKPDFTQARNLLEIAIRDLDNKAK